MINEILQPYRRRIDALDEQILALLSARMDIVREVGDIKYKHDIAPVLPDRIAEVLDRVCTLAGEKGLEPAMVRQIYTILIEASCMLEEEIAAARSA